MDAGRLAGTLVERFEITGDELLIFFSGSKGFHIGLPSALWLPGPSTEFHSVCRQFAESMATIANVAIDSGVYDRVRAFRAPNSRHGKTGRYKRILTLDELFILSSEKIVSLSADPTPFDLPTPPQQNNQAVRDWNAAVESVASRAAAVADCRHGGIDAAKLNRSTREFMLDGATTGDRHRRLFSAAANLAEFGCKFPLAFALLSESALDSGLTPADIRRQIECGLNHQGAAQ